jgi:hypothetical protein
MTRDRRSQLKTAVGVAAVSSAAPAQTKPEKRVHYRGGSKPKSTPLFSGAVSYGNPLFIAGTGAHYEGDIKAHTKTVLDDVEKD